MRNSLSTDHFARIILNTIFHCQCVEAIIGWCQSSVAQETNFEMQVGEPFKIVLRIQFETCHNVMVAVKYDQFFEIFEDKISLDK